MGCTASQAVCCALDVRQPPACSSNRLLQALTAVVYLELPDVQRLP